MMYSAALLSALAALPSLTSAIGVATVRNYCPKQLCVYTTAPCGGPITGTRVVQPNGNTSVNFPASGMVGTQVRVSPTCDPNNAVDWEFAQGNNIIYYDVNINGPTQDPFTVRGLGVTGSTSACPAISCAAGGWTACFNNPNGKPQNQVKACQATNSIYFNACRP